jgi:hypothetical protein
VDGFVPLHRGGEHGLFVRRILVRPGIQSEVCMSALLCSKESSCLLLTSIYKRRIWPSVCVCMVNWMYGCMVDAVEVENEVIRFYGVSKYWKH